MISLDRQDLNWAVRRLPYRLRKVMEDEKWKNKVYVGGGYLRSTVSGERINDVDVFVNSKEQAEELAKDLTDDEKAIHKTDNALTIRGKIAIQIIYRWVFDKPEDVSNSFDFTVCCAVIYFDDLWRGVCDENFYPDLASKRLRYRSPIRNEDAGGSMLRVLKYYQKGYRIPLDSLGAVIARLIKDFDVMKTPLDNEVEIAKIITGLLREVDPSIDPNHLAHLPSSEE